MVRCVGDLAPPDQSSRAAFDIFRFFSNCLYLAEPSDDAMYPQSREEYEDKVNDCLGL